MESILRVFADARHHIPKHRCLLLFRQLLEKLGVERYLWVTMTMVIEGAVRTKDVPVISEDSTNLADEVL